MRSRFITKPYLVVLLLVMGSIFVLIENWEHILEGVRVYLERRMSQALQAEVNIELIRELKWGNIAIDYLEVRGRETDNIPQMVVQRVIVDYSPLDILAGAFGRGLKVHLISPRIYFSSLPKKSENGGKDERKSGLLNRAKVRLLIENGTVFFWSAEPAINALEGELNVSRGKWELKRLRGYLLGMAWQGEGKFTKGDIDFTFQSSIGDITSILGKSPFGPESMASAKGKAPSNEIAFVLNGTLPVVSLRGYAALLGRLAGFSGELNVLPGLLKFTKLQVAENYSLNGEIDLQRSTGYFELLPPKGRAVLEANFTNQPDFSLTARLDHVEILGQEIISRFAVEGKADYSGKRADGVRGSFYTETTIVNNRIFRELKGNFEISDKGASITSVRFGENYFLTGSLQYSDPPVIDLSLDIRDADARDLIWFAQEQNKDAVSGRMNGKITIKGPLPAPYIRWHISGSGGNLGSEKYEYAVLNLEGNFPLVTVSDSHISLGQGYKSLEGRLDLRRIGKPNFFEGLKLISDERTMVFRGWDFVKEPGTSEVSMGKDVGKDFRVSFKTYEENKLFDPALEVPEYRSEVALEVMVGENESIKMQLRETEETIGFERKIKF